jgi:ABC-type transporter Mla subunit MlaD
MGLDPQNMSDRLSELKRQLEQGQISQGEFLAQVAKESEKFKKQIREIIDILEEIGVLTADEAKSAREALENLGDEAEDTEEDIGDVVNALEDIVGVVDGIAEIVDAFGALSDEAKEAIDGLSEVTRSLRRLYELRQDFDSFGAMFGSVSGVVGAAGAISGIVGGLASLISTSYGVDEKRQKEMEKLRKKVDENVQALRENTEAVLEQARVGENISRRTLERANELISQIASSEFTGMSGPKQERLLTQLENLAPMFEGVPDLLSNVEEYFVEEQPVSTAGEDIVDDRFMRQLAREFVLTDATAQDIVDRLYENINVSTSQGIGADELRERFGDDFLGIQERLAEIEEQFAQFSDTFSGVIEELNFRRQELGASFEQLRSTLTDRLPDLGFGGALDEILQNRIEDASRGELEELRQKLAESLAGDRDLSFLYHRLSGVSVDELLGDVTPSQFEDFLDQLGTITDVSPDESETEFSTSAAKARVITEHQANEVVSFLQELVQLARTQRDLLSTILASLGGEPPESPPAQESSSAPEAPPASEAPSGPGVGIPADLQETIAAAEANGFRPPDVGSEQRLMRKVVNQGPTVYNDITINGEMDARRVVKKLNKYINRNHWGKTGELSWT